MTASEEELAFFALTLAGLSGSSSGDSETAVVEDIEPMTANCSVEYST